MINRDSNHVIPIHTTLIVVLSVGVVNFTMEPPINDSMGTGIKDSAYLAPVVLALGDSGAFPVLFCCHSDHLVISTSQSVVGCVVIVHVTRDTVCSLPCQIWCSMHRNPFPSVFANAFAANMVAVFATNNTNFAVSIRNLMYRLHVIN